jgi:protein-disulfide isomerase
MQNANRYFRVLGIGLALTALVLAGTSTASASEIAGQVGDKKITVEDVDSRAMATNAAAYQALYDARRQALEELIRERLMELEAATRKISTEELLNKEVNQKIAPVTDAEIEAWYNANKGRVGNRTLDQVRESIRSFLAAQRAAEVSDAFFAGLKKKSGVKVSLQPPRVEIEIASTERFVGPADAVVTIVEYSDFQ